MKKLIKLLGYLRFPLFKKKTFNSAQYHAVRTNARLGDVILSKSNGFFLNWLNPSSPYKHGAIVTEITKHRIFVTEAISSGVVKTELYDFFKGKNLIGLYRFQNAESVDMEEVANKAETFLNCPYDYAFKENNRKFYCFELIVQAFSAIPSIIFYPVKTLFGNKYLAQSICDHQSFINIKEFEAKSE